jgi:uncharacterized protein with PIN domain
MIVDTSALVAILYRELEADDFARRIHAVEVCFSSALAKEKGEKLLFKGDDFSLTDVEPA